MKNEIRKEKRNKNEIRKGKLNKIEIILFEIRSKN